MCRRLVKIVIFKKKKKLYYILWNKHEKYIQCTKRLTIGPVVLADIPSGLYENIEFCLCFFFCLFLIFCFVFVCLFVCLLFSVCTVLLCAGIVMTSSIGINTAMHTIWSVLAQAPSKIFPVYCVRRTVTNWNLETSQCLIKTWLILKKKKKKKLCILKKFRQTIFVYIT